MRWIQGLAIGLLIAGSLLSCARERPPGNLAITHVNVIDMTGAPVRPDMTVVIDGDRISAVGGAKRIAVPEGAKVVDGSGKYLIPGLWDMHVHVHWPGWPESMYPLLVASGITGARDMWGDLSVVEANQAAIAEGRVVGPRFIASGNIVDGSPTCRGSVCVANADEARAAVDSLAEAGAGFIKVNSGLSREALLAIAEQASARGIAFAGHVPRAVRVTEASDAGQKSIEHLTGIPAGCSTREDDVRAAWDQAYELQTTGAPEAGGRLQAAQEFEMSTYDKERCGELARRFTTNRTWVVPTLFRVSSHGNLSEIMNDPRLKYIPPELRDQWDRRTNSLLSRTEEEWARERRAFARRLEIVGDLNEAGALILAGTDTPSYRYPGFSLHDELELLVEAGLTPLEALQAATLNAAVFLEATDSLGTIEVGKAADLVLLDANPLADIRNTQRILAVILRGEVYSRAELDELLAQAEAAAQALRRGLF